MSKLVVKKAAAKPRLQKVQLSAIQEADWNYKLDGTPAQVEKLARSIDQDKSAGVIAVREVAGGKLEAIDGNHRVRALRLLAAKRPTRWAEVYVENFGPIGKAQAVTIMRRRNHQWFEDDPLVYAELLHDAVLPEISLAELESYMPESAHVMEQLVSQLDTISKTEQELDGIDNTKPAKQHPSAKKPPAPTVALDTESEALMIQWRAMAYERFGVKSDTAVIKAALEVAIEGHGRWVKKEKGQKP